MTNKEKIETIYDYLNDLLQEVKEIICLFVGHNWKYLKPTVNGDGMVQERMCKRCNKEQSEIKIKAYQYCKFKQESEVCLKCDSVVCNPEIHDDYIIYTKWI